MVMLLLVVNRGIVKIGVICYMWYGVFFVNIVFVFVNNNC